MPSSDKPIITYSQARKAGLPRYFTGKPCKRGHISERNSANADCVACSNLRCSTWAKENQERKRAVDRAYVRSEEGKEHDREVAREKARKNRKERPELKRADQSRRRARKKGCEGKHTGDDLVRIFKLQKGKCAYCRIKLRRHHADHIIPLALKGSNAARNMQILCEPCNQKKKAKHPIEFAQSLGMLL
jgi:5-methylcytosine-specific restriction endonuclease McrA